LLDSGSKRQVYIYWGSRKAEDLYSSLPEEWANQYNHINFIPVLSRATTTSNSNHSSANAKVKYVQDSVIEHHNDLTEFEVYACGSEKMIQDAMQLLIKNGLKSENFYSDAFVPSD
jgi:CDP-4-dehydro-6-deoxyglucose reductase